MKASEAFEFGRDFQKMSEQYNFEKIAAFVNDEAGDDIGGAMDFYKLKPLFDKYGYNETIEAIKATTGKKPVAEVETRPAAEFWAEIGEIRKAGKHE